MTTSVQRRRGSTVQHSTFTGLEGEITVDTNKDTAVVHDGSTIGGFPLAKEGLENANTTNLTAIIGTDTASDDTFLIYDTSASAMKKITRAELNNAIEVDALSNVTITGGSINGTSVGATTASSGKFTTLDSSSTTILNNTTIPASKTLLVTTDIGTSVQGYDATILKSANIGVTVQGYDSTILKSADIGSTVQAYDAQLADVAGLTPTDNGVIIGNGTNFVVESGATLRTSLGLAIGTDVQAYDADLTTLGAGGSSARTFLGLGTGDSPTFTTQSLSGNLTFTGTGNRITGDFSNATVANRVAVQTSAANSSTIPITIPNGTGAFSGYQFYNNSNPTNAGCLQVGASTSVASVVSSISGTGTYLPLTMWTGGSERLRITNSGTIGMGTASPASDARLTISSLSAESYVFFQRSGVGNFDTAIGNISGATVFRGGADSSTVAGLTEFMRIDHLGKVFIGNYNTSGYIPSLLTVSRAPAIDGVTDLLTLRNDADGKQFNFELSSDPFSISAAKFNWMAGCLAFCSGAGTNAVERMRIDYSGNLLVGTTTAGGAGGVSMYQNGSGTSGLIIIAKTADDFENSAMEFYAGDTLAGTISYSNTSTTYATSSDYRLKENIAPMTGALDTVAQLKPVTYNWKSDGSEGQGFIAHELQAVVPDCVTGEKDAVDAEGKPIYQGIDVSFLVATLTAAIKEQQVMIEELKAKVAALEAA